MTPSPGKPPELRVLILAPTGKDGPLIEGAFRKAGLDGFCCFDMPGLVSAIREGAGAVLVAEETLSSHSLDLLIEALNNQPPWSDLPILLLARRGASSDTVARSLRALANVTLIERPTQVGELTSAARTALRARSRQYQIRDNMAALERSEAKLREIDRRKDEFLAMLAHELRNPLQPIGAAAEMLRSHGSSREVVAHSGEVIERQVRHLSRLLEDLLDVSRITTGKIVLRREPVEVRQLARRVVEGAARWFDTRGQKLSLELPPYEVWLDGDPARLHQIVANLLHNAAKYTHESGRITLSISEDGAEVELRVRDNGVGIEPHMVPHVFELFTQADRSLDRSAGGLGIGLRVVQKLTELHGGRVRAHSDGLGRGSEFVATFPRVAAPKVSQAPAAAVGRGAHEGIPRRILVVDDNIDAAQVLCMLLKLHGHEVDVSHDGIDAIQRARSMRPDVVVLDIGLPGASGYDVARAIRSEANLTPCLLVAVTGYGRDEDRIKCMDAGFDAHFVKPLEPQQLLDTLAA